MQSFTPRTSQPPIRQIENFLRSFDVACVKTLFEPFLPLGGRAVSERIRHYIAAHFFLQTIVADLECRIQACIDVALIQKLKCFCP